MKWENNQRQVETDIVDGWRNEELNTAPELWVERIPYPETRYYVKKVLDNLQLYSGSTDPNCKPGRAGIRQKMSDTDP